MSGRLWRAAALVILAAPASATRLYDNRQNTKERKKLERAETLSQNGASASSSESGTSTADKPFHGAGTIGGSPRTPRRDVWDPASRPAIPVPDSPYVPTTAGASITSGGPVRTRPVSDCPNASFPCDNATPYQKPMNSILAAINAAVVSLKIAAVEAKLGANFTFSILAGTLSALFIVILSALVSKIRGFLGRSYEQVQQRELLRRTGIEIQTLANQIKHNMSTNPNAVPDPAQVKARVEAAGEAQRERIRKELGPKE